MGPNAPRFINREESMSNKELIGYRLKSVGGQLWSLWGWLWVGFEPKLGSGPLFFAP